jgi:threonine dehydratase
MSTASAALRRVTLDDVLAAREILRPHLPPSPLRPTQTVPESLGDVRLKLECWQPTGSFKVRGALNTLSRVAADSATRGVVAASAGNHALGVAWAAAALGGRVPTTVFVPETAPRPKLEKLARFPVHVVRAGRDYDEAYAAACEQVERTGATYVHAFDDVLTAAGQGTLGLELLEQCPQLGTLVVPVGGGGLISGLAAAVKSLRPAVRLVAVQPEASPALRASLLAGRALTEFAYSPTSCDGLAGGIGRLVFEHRDLIDQVVTVSEHELEQALVALVDRDQLLVEPSAAVGLAALRSGRVDSLAGHPIAVVVTGANIDGALLRRLLSHGA